jgi:hypothetical protein
VKKMLKKLIDEQDDRFLQKYENQYATECEKSVGFLWGSGYDEMQMQNSLKQPLRKHPPLIKRTTPLTKANRESLGEKKDSNANGRKKDVNVI